MNSFDPFLSRLGTIHDPRRAEGKLYQLPYVLLFSILAIVSGANSYRGIRTFIKVHRRKLNKAFKIGWKRPPAHTAIRYILQGLNPADVEKVFREHAADLNMMRQFPARAFSRLTAKRSRAVSIASTTPRQNRYSALLLSIRRWCWRISRSTKNPTRYRRCKNCWKNSMWRTISSRSTRCIAKKNLRSRRRSAGASDRSTQRQPADLVS